MAAAAVTLVLIGGVGTGSAAFVDYLADRVQLRAYAAATSKKPAEQSVDPSRVKTAAIPATAAPAPDADSVVRAAKASAAAGRPLPGPAAADTAGEEAEVKSEAAGVPILDAAAVAAVKPQPEEDFEPVLAAAEADPSDEIVTGTVPADLEAYAPVAESRDTAALPEDGGSTVRTATVTEHVNLRSGPADEAKVLTVVPAKALVNVLSCESWCEVEYAGQKGFIYKRFIGNS